MKDVVITSGSFKGMTYQDAIWCMNEARMTKKNLFDVIAARREKK